MKTILSILGLFLCFECFAVNTHSETDRSQNHLLNIEHGLDLANKSIDITGPLEEPPNPDNTCYQSYDTVANNSEERVNIHLLKEMFSTMVLEKNASLIPKYYHKDFLLYTNGQEMTYASFLESHKTYYETAIQYQIEYDKETLVEQGNKIAVRLWITTSRPEESPKKIEVVLIAEYREGKIYRLWELTYPDWSKLPAFEN